MPYYRLFYHFVWSTHQRLPLITDNNRDHLHRLMHAKAEALRGVVQALNSMPDHVHLVVAVPPAIALSTFVGQIKGSASHLASRLPNAEPFKWQNEYGVLSISERHVPIDVQYVIEQQKHHAANTINQRLELSVGST